MRIYLSTLFAAVGLVQAGCFTATLDPELEGAFACAPQAEDCPEGLACDGQFCVRPDNIPLLQILSPEREERFDFADFPSDGKITVRLQGNLNLVAEGQDNANGTGYVEVNVDGETTKLTSGPLSGGISVEATIDLEAGGHRISAQAFHPDGTPFGNEGALATSLFWLDDGNPHVAIVKPWPGEALPLRTPEIETEIVTLNFRLSAPENPREGLGHAHIHYDQVFPACTNDADCDAGYLLIIAPPMGTVVNRFSDGASFPDSPAGMSTVTAVLRNNDHTPYRHPFGDEQGEFITDTIMIARVDSQ